VAQDWTKKGGSPVDEPSARQFDARVVGQVVRRALHEGSFSLSEALAVAISNRLDAGSVSEL